MEHTHRVYLGQRIVFNQRLVRRTYYNYRANGYRERMKRWDITPMAEPKEGIIVGIRTLSNGTTDYDNESGHMYDPKEHFRAILVYTSVTRKPVYVPINN